MTSDRIYTTVREDRGWYFVEYYPANKLIQYSVLNLVVTVENIDKNKIIEAMETELKEWLLRYPVPLLVYAWDNAEHLYKFDELNKPSPLMGFVNEEGKVSSYWRTGKDKTIPDARFDQEYLDNLFSSIEYTTAAEYDVDRIKRRRQIKLGYVIIVVLLSIMFFSFTNVFVLNDWFCPQIYLFD